MMSVFKRDLKKVDNYMKKIIFVLFLIFLINITYLIDASESEEYFKEYINFCKNNGYREHETYPIGLKDGIPIGGGRTKIAAPGDYLYKCHISSVFGNYIRITRCNPYTGEYGVGAGQPLGETAISRLHAQLCENLEQEKDIVIDLTKTSFYKKPFIKIIDLKDPINELNSNNDKNIFYLVYDPSSSTENNLDLNFVLDAEFSFQKDTCYLITELGENTQEEIDLFLTKFLEEENYLENSNQILNVNCNKIIDNTIMLRNSKTEDKFILVAQKIDSRNLLITTAQIKLIPRDLNYLRYEINKKIAKFFSTSSTVFPEIININGINRFSFQDIILTDFENHITTEPESEIDPEVIAVSDLQENRPVSQDNDVDIEDQRDVINRLNNTTLIVNNNIAIQIIERTTNYLGTRYVFGGRNGYTFGPTNYRLKSGLDCIGLPYVVLRDLGYIDGSTGCKEMFESGCAVLDFVENNKGHITGISGIINNRTDLDQLQPGDILFFNTSHGVFGHVGIYSKTESGCHKYIHAPRPGTRVKYDCIETGIKINNRGTRRFPFQYVRITNVDTSEINCNGNYITASNRRQNCCQTTNYC